MQTVLDAVRGEGQWAARSDSGVTTSFGNLTAIAKRLGVHRNTVLNYVNRWKTVADAIEQERELRKDFVEDKMLKRVMKGSDTMIIFFAKTQMKDRGYVERQEITHSGSVDVSSLSDDELRAIVAAKSGGGA